MTQKDHNTQIHQEGLGKPMVIKHSQRVDNILDTNEELRKDVGQQAGKDFKLAARIPLVLIHHWEQTQNLDMSRVGVDSDMTGKFWRLLQSPEYRNLRVWEGKMV